MVIGPDAGLRARLARLLSRAGYRPEVAESLVHARRAGLEGIALAIVARDGSDASDAAVVEAMTAEVGRVLVVASPGAKGPFPSDVVDLSDEAGLLARIAEALTSQPDADEAELILQFAGYGLDLAGHSLADPVGKDIPLTHSEFGLLRAFVERAGRVLSRDQLLQLTVGRDAEPYDRTVDVLVARVRRKIEPDPKRPSLIVTVPGSGYKFAAQVREARLTSAPPGPELPSSPSGPPPRTPERRHITALAAELAAEVIVVDLWRTGPEVLQALNGATVIAHNAGFELAHLEAVGVRVGELHDTAQMARLLLGVRGPNGRGAAYALENAASALCGITLNKELQTSDWGAAELSREQTVYAGADAVACYRIAEVAPARLAEQQSTEAYEIQVGAIPAISRMTERGLHFGVEAHTRLVTEWQAEQDAAFADFAAACAAAGRAPPTRIPTAEDARLILQDVLSPEELEQWPLTKNGALSTRKGDLARGVAHPLIAAVARVRKVQQFSRPSACRFNAMSTRPPAEFILAPTLPALPPGAARAAIRTSGRRRATRACGLSIARRQAAVLSSPTTMQWSCAPQPNFPAIPNCAAPSVKVSILTGSLRAI
jgi:DNA-binding winged helix-turn-helix (wHTH) protein